MQLYVTKCDYLEFVDGFEHSEVDNKINDKKSPFSEVKSNIWRTHPRHVQHEGPVHSAIPVSSPVTLIISPNPAPTVGLTINHCIDPTLNTFNNLLKEIKALDTSLKVIHAANR